MITRQQLEEILYALEYASDMTKPEGLSGCDCPICTQIKVVRDVLKKQQNLDTSEEGSCSDHPDAPHGFDRSGSHNANRYVCTCESWTPPRQHVTDGTKCWCEPVLDYVDPVTGAEVWVHREPQ